MTGLLVLAVVGLLITTVILASSASAARQQAARAAADAGAARHHGLAAAQAAEQRAAQSETRAVNAERYASSLARYQTIVDVEQAAHAMRAAAEGERQRLATAAKIEADRLTTAARTIDREARGNADSLMQVARDKSLDIVAQAHMEAQRIAGAAQTIEQQARAHADSLMRTATEQAKELVEDARGEAVQARVEVEQRERQIASLEATVTALKNVVKGYGDAYIIPSASILDDLAEHVGYAEAGQSLKDARKQVRALVKGDRAGTCDYVEKDRRETAVRFVVDAFNGKVDSILADVKDDNVGTLAQKVRDAFALVNQNGAAFRNARITNEYLEARLEELRWAGVAIELRNKEREEQRALREQIRDEERRQREVEKARKEAEREEETIRKAMEKARREAESASDAQRASYEAKLAELADKLKLAEEKNQRAISMAQQTKAGHVYVISNVGSFGEHVYKIGMTRRLNPEERIDELGDASVPFEFDIHAMIPSQDAPALEYALHKKFVATQVNKVNPRKEFFRVRLEDIRSETDKLGVEVSWTMAAACREYQESRALERALERKDPKAAAWQANQEEAMKRESARPEPMLAEAE